MIQKYHNSFGYFCCCCSSSFRWGEWVDTSLMRPCLDHGWVAFCWLWISIFSVLTSFPVRKPHKTETCSLDLNVSLLVFMAGMPISVTMWSTVFSASLIITCQTSSCVAFRTKSGGESPPQCLEGAAPKISHFRCCEIASLNLVLTWHKTNFCTKICSQLLLQLRFSCFFDLSQQCTFNIFLLI